METSLPEKFIPVREVVKRSGVNYHLLRHYTKIGLLPYMIRRLPYPEAPSTVGHYPESVLETLQKIKELKGRGLNSEQIKQELSESPERVVPSAVEGPPQPPITFYPILAEERKHNALLAQILHFLTNMIRAPLPAREPAWSKVFTHALTLALVFGTLAILSLGFSDLTHARVQRLFAGFWDQYVERLAPGEVLGIRQIANPIVDVNDALEYRDKKNSSGEKETWLRAKLPFDLDALFTNTATIASDALFNTTRLLGTLFFGQSDDYFINPLGDASLRDLRARAVDSESLNSEQATVKRLEAETVTSSSITTKTLRVTEKETVGNLNADFLDSLDSSQFLRSDVSDNYTSGTLAFNLGTTLRINGSFSCLNCLGASQISDLYLLNSGDIASGDYAFDTNTLFINSVNNRVGIGTTSPSFRLETRGSGDEKISVVATRPVTKPQSVCKIQAT